MKGQALNVDFTIAMALFLLSVITALLFASSQKFGPETGSELRRQSEIIQNNLEEQTSIEGQQAPLTISSPENFVKIPLDKTYLFKDDASDGTGTYSGKGTVNISQDRLIAVETLGNTTQHLSYFYSDFNVDKKSYSIETGDNWINNTEISVKTGSPGLESLRVNGKELLNPSADLNGASYAVEDKGIYGSSLSEDLKVYNGTSEFIVEDASNIEFDLENLSQLYWRPSNDTIPLTGTGNKASGTTSGLTVASDYGITLLGDLDATVSKPSDDHVEVSVDSDRLRVFLHDSDYKTGRKRIRLYEKADIFLGIEENLAGASDTEISQLQSEPKGQFMKKMDIQQYDYNISMGGLDRGSNIPLTDVFVSDLPSVKINSSADYSKLDRRVALWR